MLRHGIPWYKVTALLLLELFNNDTISDAKNLNDTVKRRNLKNATIRTLPIQAKMAARFCRSDRLD